MKEEEKIIAPTGYEIEKVELVDGVAVVTFKEKKRKLPKTWEEFCEMFPVKTGECRIMTHGIIQQHTARNLPRNKDHVNLLQDRATAEAIIALMQLIRLRDCYNGDWVPDWKDDKQEKYAIKFYKGEINIDTLIVNSQTPLYFKTAELRNEFFRNFRPLIEKLRPLYGIMKGGEE